MSKNLEEVIDLKSSISEAFRDGANGAVAFDDYWKSRTKVSRIWATVFSMSLMLDRELHETRLV